MSQFFNHFLYKFIRVFIFYKKLLLFLKKEKIRSVECVLAFLPFFTNFGIRNSRKAQRFICLVFRSIVSSIWKVCQPNLLLI